MNGKFLRTLPLVLALILSACGGGATPAPALNAVDLQNTAIANAWLAMTQTQMATPPVFGGAMPTATATFIPAPMATPIATFIAIPTLPLLQSSPLAPVGNPTTDPCNEPPPAKPKGATVQVRFLNKSDFTVTTLSFGMLQPNAQGECGTYSFSLGKFETVTATVLAGCYWAFAYVDKPSSAKNMDALCVFDTTKAVAIWVTAELIFFH